MRPVVRVASLPLVVITLVAFGGDRNTLRPRAADELPPAGDAAVARDDEDDPAVDDPEEQDEEDDEVDETEGVAVPFADDDSAPMSAADAGKRKRLRGGCPSTMVRVRAFCIDRHEAPNRRGARPLVMQSANDATAWCSAHRKRLCTEDEWIAACEGEEHRAYPYGSEYVDGRCNDDKPWRQVDEAALAKWPSTDAQALAKSLYQATPSGSKRKCVSESGARDLTGNVEEWVVRTREHANDWPYILIGCYWSGCYGGGKPTCHSTNNAHGPEFRFYETGFRCCREAGTRSKQGPI